MEARISETFEKTAELVSSAPDADPSRLLLGKNSLNAGADLKLAASTLEARRRIKGRIPDWYSCTRILVPNSKATEQCSSQITAIYKANLVNEGERCADLTGGMGIDTWFLSRRASSVDYYERQELLSACSEWNFRELGADNVKVFNMETTSSMLQKLDRTYDTVFIDPSRRDSSSRRVYGIHDCEPDLAAIKDDIFRSSPRIIAKLSPMIDLRDTFLKLENVRSCHVVSVKNECKELLVILEKGVRHDPDEIPVTAVNLGTEEPAYTFTFSQERNASCRICTSADETEGFRFISEPNRSVLKGGAFRKICHDFSMTKAGNSTHLYFSDSVPEAFPGKTYRIENICGMDRKSVRTLLTSYRSAEIAVRDIPASTEQIRKKIGIADGDGIHIFATSLCGRTVLIVCSPVRR